MTFQRQSVASSMVCYRAIDAGFGWSSIGHVSIIKPEANLPAWTDRALAIGYSELPLHTSKELAAPLLESWAAGIPMCPMKTSAQLTSLLHSLCVTVSVAFGATLEQSSRINVSLQLICADIAPRLPHTIDNEPSSCR